MTDEPNNREAGTHDRSAAADHAGLRERATRDQSEGLRALEASDFDRAVKFLLGAVAAFEELGDAHETNSTAHYLGVALAAQGESSRAQQVWEEIIQRGLDSPAAFNCLIRHYQSQGDFEQVQRLYESLQLAAIEKTGEFFRYLPSPAPTSHGEPLAGEDRPPRLLVADDDPSTCAAIERMLSPLGYAVDVVMTGGDALDAIMSTPLDMIILDVYMPVHSGLDILYRMRAEAIDTPVIVISGAPDEAMVRDARELGTDFLAKPFTRDEVVELVARYVGEGRISDHDS